MPENYNNKHHDLKRKKWHDYGKRGIYMLTVNIDGKGDSNRKERHTLLGTLAGKYDAPKGTPDYPHIVLSEFGKIVRDIIIPKIHKYNPNVQIWKTCIMPDHIHLIVCVETDFEGKRNLGTVVSGFKGGCSRAYYQIQEGLPATGENDDKDSGALRQRNPKLVPQFEEGYNDRILSGRGQLKNWQNYLSDNPRRLAVKRAHRNFFTVVNNFNVLDMDCQIIGNRFLLDIPNKVAVIVHRKDTNDEFQCKKQEWLDCGEAGGVIVSAAISPREKEVMHEAIERGYCIIYLKVNGFPNLYKPCKRDFDICAEGRLLEICPFGYNPFYNNQDLRKRCLKLNKLAEDIVKKV
ncbi:MAG: hypothetical protein MJZ66_04050 [Bacteroidales bacterium]|nr:hypothetical protein [Bacteroidales bacterium]